MEVRLLTRADWPAALAVAEAGHRADPDFGVGLAEPWQPTGGVMLADLADPRRRVAVVADGPVVAVFAYGLGDDVELLYFEGDERAVPAAADALKARASASRRRVVAWLPDGRDLRPWQRCGFAASRARGHFGDVDGWRLLWVFHGR